jgi:hypothetical protein
MTAEVRGTVQSGRETESNPDDVLDFGAGHVEVGRDLGEPVSGREAVHQVLDSRAPVNDERPA